MPFIICLSICYNGFLPTAHHPLTMQFNNYSASPLCIYFSQGHRPRSSEANYMRHSLHWNPFSYFLIYSKIFSNYKFCADWWGCLTSTLATTCLATVALTWTWRRRRWRFVVAGRCVEWAPICCLDTDSWVVPCPVVLNVVPLSPESIPAWTSSPEGCGSSIHLEKHRPTVTSRLVRCPAAVRDGAVGA